MNVVADTIPIKRDKPVTIVPLGDLHVGHTGFEKERFLDIVNWIEEHEVYTILMGDMVDAISKADKRYETNSIAEEFKPHIDNIHYKQTDTVIKYLEPIKDRILGSVPGNHEHTTKKAYSYDSNAILCEQLGVPALTDPGYIKLNLKRTRTSTFAVNIFVTHGVGVGGGRKPGAKVNNIVDFANGFDADIYLAGHSHNLFAIQNEYVRLNNAQKLVTSRRTFCNTGTFLNAYPLNDNTDSWASRQVFMPQKLGVVRIDIELEHSKDRGYYISTHARA